MPYGHCSSQGLCDCFFDVRTQEYRRPTKVVYIFLRKDLERINPMYPAIQLGHAVYELRGQLDLPFTPDRIPDTFVVLEVENQFALQTVAQDLQQLTSFHFHMFEEPDHDTGFTALAVEPISSPIDRQWFKPYRLYRRTFWQKLKALFSK